MPNEPCEVAMLEPGLERMASADGYRFRQTVEHQELRRPLNLNDRAFVWATDRSVGAYLAPDRGREEVVGGQPGGSLLGFDAAVTVAGRSWMYHVTSDTWSETEVAVPANRADAFNVAYGGQPLRWAVVDDVDGLPGSSGCVLSASVAREAAAATFSVRIDPIEGRVVAWWMEFLPDDPDEGGGIRQSMEIEYVLPSEGEIQPPATFEPLRAP